MHFFFYFLQKLEILRQSNITIIIETIKRLQVRKFQGEIVPKGNYLKVTTIFDAYREGNKLVLFLPSTNLCKLEH